MVTGSLVRGSAAQKAESSVENIVDWEKVKGISKREKSSVAYFGTVAASPARAIIVERVHGVKCNFF
ncbi:MAG: hypothetical protein IH624_18050 [Phycisphaerae bacterium]|nr:hypothetical protein [Phycisphaerae bacterium]